MTDQTKTEHKPLTAEEIEAIRKRWESLLNCWCLHEDRIQEIENHGTRDISGLLATIDTQQATITAQDRLLALAGTLADAATQCEQAIGYPSPDDLKPLYKAVQAFDAACKEYSESGAVPCGECEALRSQIDSPAECFDCGSAIQGFCPHCAPLERERLTVLMHEIRSKVRDKGLDIYERLPAIGELVREALAGKEPTDG